MKCANTSISQDDLFEEALATVTGLDGEITNVQSPDVIELLPSALEDLARHAAKNEYKRHLFRTGFLDFNIKEGRANLGELVDQNRILLDYLYTAEIQGKKNCSQFSWQFIENRQSLQLHSFIERHFVFWTLEGCLLRTRNPWGEMAEKFNAEAQISASYIPTLDDVPESLRGTLTQILADRIKQRMLNPIDALKAESTIRQQSIDEAKARELDASCDNC